MSEELKPARCGCGGEAEVIKHTFHGASPSYGVECTNCHTESSQFYDTEAEAIMAWNKAMGGNVQDCAKNARCPDPDDLISRRDAVIALGDAHFKNYGNAIMVIQDLPARYVAPDWSGNESY